MYFFGLLFVLHLFKKMNNNSQSAAEDSLLQFERLEQQLNGSTVRRTPETDQRQQLHPSYRPSVQELDDDGEQDTLQLPAHEPFMRQGMGGNGGAEGDSDLPVELSYQRLLLQENSPSIDAASNTSSNERPSPVPSSLSSIAGRVPPKTTPRTTTASTLIAPLKVPDFKQGELLQPPPPFQLPMNSRPPLQQLNVPNFKQSDLRPPSQHQKMPFSIQKTRPLYQSTPHNKPTMMKPTTPNGHQISPIPEECELDQLVSALIDDHKQGVATITDDQRAVKNLITQLRDVIAQWDWAQARHRHVAKIFFERQNDELNVKWEQLNAEVSKFNEMKADEWAQIAKVRAGLRAEREKRLGKKEADRIVQLENELAELKAKDARASRQVCELRTRNRELKGVVQVREESYAENMLRLKKLESQLVSAEQENSKLRTRLKLIRQESEKENQQQHQQVRTAPNQQHQQVRTAPNQQQQMRTAPRSAPASTTAITAGQQQQRQQQQQLRLQTEPTRNFRWVSDSCGCAMASHGTDEKVQIDYLHAERLYEVRMPRGHLMRFMLSGHLELHWANGDRTLMFPDGERRELYSPERSNFSIEIFMSSGVAYRLNAQTQWLREEFVPDPTRMSVRSDGSFAAKHVEDQPGLQINSPDFQLRRFSDTNAVKLALDRSAGIQLWLCTDNVLLVKHVFRPAGSDNSGEGAAAATSGENMGTNVGDVGVNISNNTSPTQKQVCFSLGRCRHINT